MIEPSYDSNSDNDLGKIHCNFNRWTFYLSRLCCCSYYGATSCYKQYVASRQKLSHGHGKASEKYGVFY